MTRFYHFMTQRSSINMSRKIFLFVLAFASFHALAQALFKAPRCCIPGECTRSSYWTQNTNDRGECLRACQADPFCEWWTWYSDGFCALFDDKDCGTIDTTCSGPQYNCWSGEDDCTTDLECNIQCEMPGQCASNTIAAPEIVSDKDYCADELCLNNEDCEFYTFDSITKICSLYDHQCSAAPLDTGCASCITGENECGKRCSEPGSCNGQIENSFQAVLTEEECLTKCQADADCKYYTFNFVTGMCVLYSTCDSVDGSCTYCVWGENRCTL